MWYYSLVFIGKFVIFLLIILFLIIILFNYQTLEQGIGVFIDSFKMESQAEHAVLYPATVQQFGGECCGPSVFNADWVFKAPSSREGEIKLQSNLP